MPSKESEKVGVQLCHWPVGGELFLFVLAGGRLFGALIWL